MIIKLGERYLNLDNLNYTSDIRIGEFILLYFKDGDSVRVSSNEEIEKLKEVFEKIRWRPT